MLVRDGQFVQSSITRRLKPELDIFLLVELRHRSRGREQTDIGADNRELRNTGDRQVSFRIGDRAGGEIDDDRSFAKAAVEVVTVGAVGVLRRRGAAQGHALSGQARQRELVFQVRDRAFRNLRSARQAQVTDIQVGAVRPVHRLDIDFGIRLGSRQFALRRTNREFRERRLVAAFLRILERVGGELDLVLARHQIHARRQGEPIAAARFGRHRGRHARDKRAGAVRHHQPELRRGIGDAGSIQSIGPADERDFDGAAVGHRLQSHRASGRRLHKQGGRFPPRFVVVLDLDDFAIRSDEPHLELALDHQELQVRSVFDDRRAGQEQNLGVPLGDLRQIGVEPRVDHQAVVQEAELAAGENLAIGADAQPNLRVERFGASQVRGRQRRLGRDEHGRDKRREETAEVRVCLDRFVLRDHLLSNFGHPHVRVDAGHVAERLARQLLRLRDRRQALEELQASRQFVDRQTGEYRLDDERRFDTESDAERPKFAEREPHRESLAGDFELALHADEQHAVHDRRGRVSRLDFIAGRIDSNNPADQLSADFGAAKIAADLNGDRFQPNHRELALGQQPHVDLEALDAAAEVERHARHLGDGGGHREDKVRRPRLDVLPLDSELGDPDRQPARPLHRAGRSLIHAQEYAEAWQSDKFPIGREREVTQFAANLQWSRFHLRPDRLEARDILVAFRFAIDLDSPSGDRHERREIHLELIGVELESGRLAVLESQCRAHAFIVRIRAVADLHRDRLAGQ